MHSAEPPSEYCPAPHTSPADEFDAAAHAEPGNAVQLTHDVAADAEYVPGAHITAVGLPEPGVGHAKPAEHAEHDASPAREKRPAAHTNALGLLSLEPAGHA